MKGYGPGLIPVDYRRRQTLGKGRQSRRKRGGGGGGGEGDFKGVKTHESASSSKKN